MTTAPYTRAGTAPPRPAGAALLSRPVPQPPLIPAAPPEPEDEPRRPEPDPLGPAEPTLQLPSLVQLLPIVAAVLAVGMVALVTVGAALAWGLPGALIAGGLGAGYLGRAIDDAL